MSTNGWFADPSGIHELRFFDGATWTEHVVDHGIRGVHHWRPAGPILVDTASWYAPTTIRPAGDYAATPGYPGAGWSQPSPPPIPPKSNHQLGIIAAVIALVVLVGVSLAAYAIAHDPAPTDPVATPSSPPIATASPKPTPTSAPNLTPGEPGQGGPPAPPGPPGKPALNASARPISVVGPTFAAGEPTYTMAFQGWPFAFRVPSTFGCIKGKLDLPGAQAWVCVNEANPGSRHRVNVMFRPCPTTCTASEQRNMTTTWFEEPGRTPIKRDATTSYLKFPSNDRGLYGLDMSHFFGSKPGGPLRWQVGIYVESPTSTKATMHKVVNDVRSQTP